MTDSLPRELLHQFDQEGGVVLFAGAGFGRAAVSVADATKRDPMPLADDLTRSLARLLVEPLVGSVGDYQLGQVADFYVLERRGQKRDLIEWLRGQLNDRERRLPDLICAALQRIPFRGFITTNYDTLIERGLRWGPSGREPVVWTHESIVPPLGPETVYKLCGSIEKGEESILLTDTDFDLSFGWRNREVAERLQQYLRDSTLLFVGYRLRDPFFRLAWSDLIRRFGTFQRRAYAVIRTVDPHTERYWAERQVTLIKSDTETFMRDLMVHFDPTADLDALLLAIAKETRASREAVEQELRDEAQLAGQSLSDVAQIHWRWLKAANGTAEPRVESEAI